MKFRMSTAYSEDGFVLVQYPNVELRKKENIRIAGKKFSDY